ncbi:hypothetical protein D1AOALGA4SA_8577 [Olavius algarvensis Delta 1 endosymbiont]|nr:hypothetical protein D1AOALGA4SA_8577 [Olavius algarvensis Delta 1 endosymbiont]
MNCNIKTNLKFPYYQNKPEIKYKFCLSFSPHSKMHAV